MMNKIKPRYFSMYLILLLAMLYTLIDSTFKLYAISYNKLNLVIVITISFSALYLFYEIKYLWITIFTIFFIPEPFYIFRHFKVFYETTKGLFESLIVNQFIAQEYSSHFTLLVFIIMPFIAAALFYSVIIKKKTLPTLILGSGILTVYYYLGNDQLFQNTSIFLSMALVLYSLNQYMHMKKGIASQDTEIRSNFFKRLMSFSIILVVLVSFLTRILPYDFKPVSYDWVDKNIISRIENIQGRGDKILSQASQKSGFNLSSTGYQPNPKRLGGPIKINDNLALRIITDETNKEIHLRGSIKDSYTGELWEKSDKATQRYVYRIDSGAWGSNYIIKSIKIFHEGLQTSTAFNVLYPESLQNSYNYLFVDSDLEIFNPKIIKKGRSYDVDYRDYNITKENNSRLKSSTEIVKDEELKKYLTLPALSDRVKKLTEEITKKYNTPYEKASAIEEYLKKNYVYDKNTSILPEGREFVDYFLFDEKKGYCTYYATSMAVMCRLANIPSRYVEGFAVMSGSSSGATVGVLNSDAHAWVELYFSNTGWVTFDPTPGHESPAMLLNTNNNNETNEETSVGNNDTPNHQEKPNNNDPGEDNTNTQNEETKKISMVSMYFLSFGTALILIFLLYLIMNRIRNNNITVKNLIKLLVSYGKLAKIPIMQGETIREYLERLSVDLNIENGIPGSIIFEDVLYGGRTLTNEDILFIRELHQAVKQRAIERNGRFKFFVLDFWGMVMFWRK